MTEAEARTRWCPFVRVGASSPTGSVITVNRHGPGMLPQELCCIGSDCAMWESSGVLDMAGNGNGDCGLKRPGGSSFSQRMM